MSRARRLLHRLDPIFQIGLVIGLAEVYRLLRRLIPTDWPQAIANAQHVERLERVAHFSWEQGIQAWFLRFPDVVKGMNWFYLSSHFVVTGAFFVWLYWRNREGFSIFRDGFLLATAIALVIHWRYPTAPPRLANMGVKDTIDLYSGVNIGKPHHERFSNPVAAVPSLHAGWALALGDRAHPVRAELAAATRRSAVSGCSAADDRGHREPLHLRRRRRRARDGRRLRCDRSVPGERARAGVRTFSLNQL